MSEIHFTEEEERIIEKLLWSARTGHAIVYTWPRQVNKQRILEEVKRRYVAEQEAGRAGS